MPEKVAAKSKKRIKMHSIYKIAMVIVSLTAFADAYGFKNQKKSIYYVGAILGDSIFYIADHLPRGQIYNDSDTTFYMSSVSHTQWHDTTILVYNDSIVNNKYLWKNSTYKRYDSVTAFLPDGDVKRAIIDDIVFLTNDYDGFSEFSYKARVKDLGTKQRDCIVAKGDQASEGYFRHPYSKKPSRRDSLIIDKWLINKREQNDFDKTKPIIIDEQKIGNVIARDGSDTIVYVYCVWTNHNKIKNSGILSFGRIVNNKYVSLYEDNWINYMDTFEGWKYITLGPFIEIAQRKMCFLIKKSGCEWHENIVLIYDGIRKKYYLDEFVIDILNR